MTARDRPSDPRGMVVGFLLVAGAAASWGTWSLFLRPTHAPTLVANFVIFAAMGVAALPFAWFEPRGRWDRVTLALLAGNAALDALNALTFFSALAQTTVAVAVLTHYVAPILIAIAAPRIDGTTSRGTRPAAAIALVGLVIVLEPWRAPAAGAMIGAALGLTSAVCYAGNLFVVRRLAARVGVGRAIAYHSLLAAAVMLPFVLRGLAKITAGDVELLAAGGATIGAISAIAFVVGLSRIGAARTAVLVYAEPLVAVAVGAIAWHEPLHPIAAVGGAIVLGAGIHVSRQARRG